jgi:hypothetical protein
MNQRKGMAEGGEREMSANLLAIVTFSMNKNLANLDTFTTCSQSILHTLTTGIRWMVSIP